MSKTLVLMLGLLAMPLAVHADATVGVLTGTVTDATTGEALPGVNVTVVGSIIGTTTQVDGSFMLEVPAGAPTVQVSYVGFKTITETLDVEAGEQLEKQFELEEDLIGTGELVVVGARQQGRTVIDSAVPIDVLGSQELRNAGQTETAQLLQVMAPSVDFPRVAMGDGTETVRPVYFRGLGPDQVLVLVNGKRRHIAAIRSGSSTAGVDLNAIPTDAIERIEILRDGASAQYGSDAVAGVFNIVLREDTGTHVSLKSGLYQEGDGETALVNAGHGFRLGSSGFLNFTGEFRYQGMVNRAGTDGNQQYWGTIVDGETGEVIYDPLDVENGGSGLDEDALNAAWEQNPQQTFRMGDPYRVDGGLFFNSEVPLAGATLYSFGGLTRRYAESGCYWRRPNQSSRYSELYPNGFLPLYSNYSTDASIAAGLKGMAAGWSWDLSSQYGGNLFDRNMKNTHNASYGPASPTRMDVGTHTFQQVTLNGDVFRTVDIGMRNPLGVSVGSEARFENYILGAGQPESYLDGGYRIPAGPDAGAQPSVGCQCFPGFRPSDEVNDWRNNVGVYLDLSMDVTQALFLTGAVRFENYSDFGTALTYKAAGRFEFVEGYAVRGAVNTGFRAPALLQSYYASTQTGFYTNPETGAIEGREVRTFPVDSPEAQALGATPLEPETSLNFSGGLTMNPIPDLVITADYYNIQVRDRVVLTSNFFRSNALVADLFDAAGLYNIQGGRFFTNAIDTRTYGLDLVARYGITLGSFSKVKLTASANFTRNRVAGITGTPPELVALEENIFDEERKMGFEMSYPRENLSLMLNYDRKRLGVMVRGWRPGEIIDAATGDVDGDGFEERLVIDGYNRVPPTFLTDVEVQYRFTNALTLAAGGTNVFDRRPPLAQSVDAYGRTWNSSFNGNFPYVNQFNNSFGTAGAYYYIRARYNF